MAFHQQQPLFRALALAWLASALTPAWAQWGNTDFLKESPIGHFSRDDVALMQKTLQNVLNTAPDGQAVEWRNDQTGSHGRITPSKAPAEAVGCRRVVVENFHDSRQSRDDYVMCKDAGTGHWMKSGVKPSPDKAP